MATISDKDSLAKKRSRQDSSDPETNCQKCDKIIKDKIMCQGCKLDYCLACAKITPTMFECMVQGEMEDFYWSCRSCKATMPSLDNITVLLKDMQKESNERMARLESRVGVLESGAKEAIQGSVSSMKQDIISSLKEDINKLVDTRHVELEERKRRETNIVLFNLPEHNSPVGLTNKHADERDVNEISRYLGQESLNVITLFRLGKKIDDKIRPLKVVLDSKSERKFLLDNAKFIEEKVPEKFKRVIISRDMTNAQRAERKTHQRRNKYARQTAQQATPRSPVAMVTEQPVPSPIQNMPHVNILSDSHLIPSGQNQEDLYNNTTVMQDETIPGGFTQSQGGFLPNMGDLTDSDS